MGSYAPGKDLSLLTTIRIVYREYEWNIISGLSMVFRKAIRAYCFNPNPLMSFAPESRLYCSRILKLRRLPQRGVDLYQALTGK